MLWKNKKYWNLHIDSFFLNRMHQKTPVRFRRDLTLINRLYRERLLFLGQEVDSEISNQLIGLMIYLSIEDDMYGVGCFNGIFYPGRRRNYQTSSIPSRLAPMRLLFERKKKTMPSPYEIWILSNNSMALWIRYKKFCFQNIRLCIERVIWEKGISDLLIGSPVQRHKLFFTPEVS